MTNAEYIEAIGARCSRRTYSHTPPDPRVLEILQEMVDAVNRQSGLSFRLLADGTAPFTLFTGKFALVAVCGPDTEWARIQSGYFGESIVLQCVYHGLGTCWVTGTYNENKLYQMLDLPRDLRLYGVITIGNVKPGKSMKEKMMYNATHKTNKPYQKMMEAGAVCVCHADGGKGAVCHQPAVRALSLRGRQDLCLGGRAVLGQEPGLWYCPAAFSVGRRPQGCAGQVEQKRGVRHRR